MVPGGASFGAKAAGGKGTATPQPTPNTVVLLGAASLPQGVEKDLEECVRAVCIENCISIADEVRYVSPSLAFIDFPYHEACRDFLRVTGGNLKFRLRNYKLQHSSSARPEVREPIPSLDDGTMNAADGTPLDRPTDTIMVRQLGEIGEAGLQQAFCQVVPIVKSVRILTDRHTRKSKGFGFVQFWSVSEAETAMSRMLASGSMINGRKVSISFAKPQTHEEALEGEMSYRSEQDNIQAASQQALTGINADMWASYLQFVSDEKDRAAKDAAEAATAARARRPGAAEDYDKENEFADVAGDSTMGRFNDVTMISQGGESTTGNAPTSGGLALNNGPSSMPNFADGANSGGGGGGMDSLAVVPTPGAVGVPGGGLSNSNGVGAIDSVGAAGGPISGLGGVSSVGGAGDLGGPGSLGGPGGLAGVGSAGAPTGTGVAGGAGGISGAGGLPGFESVLPSGLSTIGSVPPGGHLGLGGLPPLDSGGLGGLGLPRGLGENSSGPAPPSGLVAGIGGGPPLGLGPPGQGLGSLGGGGPGGGPGGLGASGAPLGMVGGGPGVGGGGPGVGGGLGVSGGPGSVGGASGMPAMGGISGLPGLPGMPGIQGMPAMPGVAGLGMAGLAKTS